jgi:hypothetical protein
VVPPRAVQPGGGSRSGDAVAAAGERAVARPVSPSLREAAWVWTLHGVFVVLTLVTYTRVAPEQLYNVSRTGIAAGASRALVYLNFPLAFVAIAVLALCVARLRGRRAAWVAAAGALLCAVAAVPGVLELDDLDARPVNAVPALGVAIAAALTVAAFRRGGLGARGGALPGDPVRIVLAVLLAAIAVPWLFAEAGFYAPDPIFSEEVPLGETLAAVHLGRHHGTDGVLLALSALALGRALPSLRGRLQSWLSVYLALVLCYGVALAAEDFWLEQVVKRGASGFRLPSLIQPELEWGWLGIVVGAATVETVWFRRERRPTRPAPT